MILYHYDSHGGTQESLQIVGPAGPNQIITVHPAGTRVEPKVQQ